MAAVYDLWKNPLTNQKQLGFAIITTTASELFMQIGVNRMPVILPIGRENDWLKTDRMLIANYAYYISFRIDECLSD